MTLLTALFAALISTVVWYFKDGSNRMQTGTLSLMYWGASLMWLVDAVFEYVNDGAAYFLQTPAEIQNDFLLGISVVALGMVICLFILLIKDPRGVIRNLLCHSKKKMD